MKRFYVGVMLAVLGLASLSACEGDSSPQATNAPIIPPTATATFTPSTTPVPTSFALTPTAVLAQPSWTASPSPTTPPTRTRAPSLTPRPPSATPQPFSPIRELSEGRYELTVLVEQINAALEDSPSQARLSLDVDGIRLSMTVSNPLLDQTTLIRAEVAPELTASGVVRLTLVGEYRVEGPAVTREQVLSALEDLIPFLDQAIRTAWTDGAMGQLEAVRTGAGALILEVQQDE